MRRWGKVYTAAVGVYKLPTTPENNMQAGHTDSNTDKLCPRQLHAMHTQTPCECALSPQLSLWLEQASAEHFHVVIGLRRFTLVG